MTSDPLEPLRLIGYWRFIRSPEGYPGMSAGAANHWERLRQLELGFPDPLGFVDLAWNRDEQHDLARYLEVGTLVDQYRGISKCRLCGCTNGSAEMAAGTFCWPEGLAHYVAEHHVRLPHAVIDHALELWPSRAELPRPQFNELGNRARGWPPPAFRHLLWTPPPGTDDRFGFEVEADPRWWLEQTSWAG